MPINEYDEILSKGQSATGNEYDDLINQGVQEQKKVVQQAVYVASKQSPDKKAEALRLSKEVDLPVDVVERNMDMIQAKATQDKVKNDYDKIVDDSPALAQFLGNPENATLAQDDLPNLQKMEKGVRLISKPKDEDGNFIAELGRATKGGYNQLETSSWLLSAAYGMTDVNTAAEAIALSNQKAAKVQEMAPNYAKEFSNVLAKESDDVQAGFNQFVSSFDQMREGKILESLKNFSVGGAVTVGETLDMIKEAAVRPKGLTYSTFEQLANSFPSLITGATGAVTGTAIGSFFPGAGNVIGGTVGFVGGSFMGSLPVEVGSTINEQLAKKGFDLSNPDDVKRAFQDPQLMANVRADAERKGLTTASVDALFNAFAGKFAVKGVSRAARAANKAADVAVQMVGEGASEFAGQVAREKGDLTRVSFGEAVQEGIISLGHSVGETVIGASRRAVYAAKTSLAATEVQADTEKAIQTVHDVQALEEIGQTFKESKLAGRSPEKVKEMIDVATGGEGAQSVFFQSDDWDSYWTKKGESPAKAAENILGDDAKKYFEAKETGTPIEIPVSDYVTKVGGTEDFDALNGFVRTTPDGMTTQEAQEHMASLPATMEDLAKEAGAIETGETDAVKSAKAVKENVTSQLKELGYKDKDAKAYSDIYEATFRTLGERTGVAPLDLFNKYGLKIQRPESFSDARDAQVFNQGIVKLDSSDSLSRAKDLGFNVDAPVYHGTSSKFDSFNVNPKGINTYGEGVYFSTDKMEAEGFGAERLIEAFVRDSNPINLGDTTGSIEVDLSPVYDSLGIKEIKLPASRSLGPENGAINNYRRLEYSFQKAKGLTKKQAHSQLREALISAGFTSLNNDTIKNILDPKNIRATSANFSPEEIESTNIYAQEGRGRIRFGDDRQFNIDLLKSADPSTFIHETGHFYLEMMGDLAADSADLKADYDEILNWLGVESRDQIKTEHHEKWARGFEAYLMEGKAPTSALQKTFNKMKVWLVSVYRQLRNLNVELTDEVRGVMDRLMATQDEIENARAEMNQDPMFQDPVAMGMSDAEAAKYIEASEEARIYAEETVAKKAMDDYRKTISKEFKPTRERIKKEVAAEINEQRITKAQSILKSGKMPDGSALPNDFQSLKLNKDVLVGMYNKEFVQNNLKGFYTTKDGVHPDVAAGILGFESGDAMVTELANTPKAEDRIKFETDRRVQETFGDIYGTGQMSNESIKAVHNDKRSHMLRMELQHLASNNLPALKGVVKKLVRRVPPSKMVQEQAKKIVGSRKISDLKPYTFKRAESKYAREAGQAFAKGDIELAFDLKQKEYLNHEMFRAAVEAQDTVKKKVKDFKKLFKKDQDLSKTRDVDLVNAARAVLAEFGIGKTDRSAVSYLESIRQYDPDAYETVSALVESAIDGATNYENITYDRFTDMKDSVDALWDLSKTSREIEIDGVKLDKNQVKAELMNRIGEVSSPRHKPGYDKALTQWDKTKMYLLGIRASLTRAENWAQAMDFGKRNGVFTKYFINPVMDATDTYRVQKRQFIEKYLKLTEGIKDRLTQNEIKASEIGYTFKGKQELLGALLHVGNESNLQKLLLGRGWGSKLEDGSLDKTAFQNMLDRFHKEGVLDKKDWDFIQSMWDLMEDLKPQAQKTHKKLYGFYFNEVTADKITTPFGEYRGGYAPAVADTFLSEDGAIRSEKDSVEKLNNSFMFPTTGRGFTKSRVEQYATPLSIDLALVPAHIDKVLRFVHIEPAIKQVSRIVMDKEFRAKLADHDPTVASDLLVPWLQRTGQQAISTPAKGWGGRGADRFFRELRTRVGLQVMTANVVNTAQQITGLSIGAVKVKHRHLRNALWQYVRNSKQMNQDISDRSNFMKTRTDAHVLEVQKTIDDLLLNPTKYEKAKDFAKKHGYFLQQHSQNIVDSIVWAGAYNQEIEVGASEKEAVRAADAAVRLTQGSFDPESISRFETGNPFVRMFTMFYSYFNMQANLMQSEFQILTREMGLRKGAGRALYLYTFGFMMPAFFSEVIVQAGKGKLDEDDDDEYLDDVMAMFFGSQVRTLTAMVPVAGQTLNAGINAFNDKWYDDKISTSPSISMVESAVGGNAKNVYRLMQGKEVSAKKAAKDTLTLIGLLTGLPLAPVGRPVGYLIDVSEGKTKPSGPIDFTRGLVTGRGSD